MKLCRQNAWWKLVLIAQQNSQMWVLKIKWSLEVRLIHSKLAFRRSLTREVPILKSETTRRERNESRIACEILILSLGAIIWLNRRWIWVSKQGQAWKHVTSDEFNSKLKEIFYCLYRVSCQIAPHSVSFLACMKENQSNVGKFLRKEGNKSLFQRLQNSLKHNTFGSQTD